MLVDKVEELLTEVRLLQDQHSNDAECYQWLLNYVKFDDLILCGELSTVRLKGCDLDNFIKLNVVHKC